MRLYLLPVSTRRTLLYCQRLDAAQTEPQLLVDRVQARAAKIWAGWESKEKGWQKTVVNYGNYAFRRIPYEEWGLKSVPPLPKRREEEVIKRAQKIEVVFPQSLISAQQAPRILHTLATEREALHRRKMTWCFVGMPFTAPIALIPVVPNLPFFYLVYRAWSHWRAISGGKHVQFLLKQNLLSYAPSPILDKIYAKQKGPLPSSPRPTTGRETTTTPQASSEADQGETMVLSQASGKEVAQAFDLHELEVELERAVWQVETAIKKQNDELAKTRGDDSSGEKPGSSTHAESKKPIESRKDR